MNADIHLEHRAGSSQDKHEGESSFALCDRLDRTRDNSQRQLPTDHDYAVPTREYQTDQSSLKTAPTAARSVFGKRKRKPPKQTHRSRPVDTVTPYQANALIELFRSVYVFAKWPKNRISSNIARQLASGRFADYSAKWTLSRVR
jgi:hypothetical protein